MAFAEWLTMSEALHNIYSRITIYTIQSLPGSHISLHTFASKTVNAQTAYKAGADLEGLPSLGRACDVHDSASAKHVVGIPYLDSIKAHHLGVLQGNLLH